MISVTVRFFASSRERAGRSVDRFELTEPYTVGHLLELLTQRYPTLGPLMRHLRIAVEHEFAESATPLGDGQEVALIPPVAGGAPELLSVVDRPLDLREVIDAVAGVDHGAVVTFSGHVRNLSHGKRVLKLEYEAFAPMAVKVFHHIAEEARAQWPGARLAVMHRAGTLEPGAIAVVIAASAAHRQDAFAVCQHVIEQLKRDAPIWKKEFFDDGEAWVGLGP